MTRQCKDVTGGSWGSWSGGSASVGNPALLNTPEASAAAASATLLALSR
eukprot:CAMPEP_0171932886 /NCGR_PEP_ID=MMETSP0993-20121228/30762_1 /TAXON_ID=483369 /ORGANISM="non described non described, Strain CCMP2098" /LENGTH=48 /DNA_ID= /DNA_START= /DNA_END= /DNA_ORIENTATION=